AGMARLRCRSRLWVTVWGQPEKLPQKETQPAARTERLRGRGSGRVPGCEAARGWASRKRGPGPGPLRLLLAEADHDPGGTVPACQPEGNGPDLLQGIGSQHRPGGR